MSSQPADKRHGQWGTKLHRQWLGMRQRCTNPKHPSFKHYGARGIKVCDAWSDFRVYMAWCQDNGYVWEAPYRQELDRIDYNGNYEPDNCRWVAPQQNRRNTRAARMLKAFGETKSMSDWADDSRCAVPYYALRTRINRGWSAEKAITTPPNKPGVWHSERISPTKGTGMSVTAFGETKPLVQWVEDPRCAVSYFTLHSRIFRRSWDAEEAISSPKRNPFGR